MSKFPSIDPGQILNRFSYVFLAFKGKIEFKDGKIGDLNFDIIFVLQNLKIGLEIKELWVKNVYRKGTNTKHVPGLVPKYYAPVLVQTLCMNRTCHFCMAMAVFGLIDLF